MRTLTLTVAVAVASGAAQAASQPAAAALAPDSRPVLLLEPAEGPLQLMHHAVRSPLPLAWRTSEPDRGFSQGLLMQLSQTLANWPWRSLIIDSSGPETDSQLQTLEGQDAVVAVLRDELLDLDRKVEFHVSLQLTTVRSAATTHETRSISQVEYFAPPLTGDSRRPRRSRANFALDGPLDDQVSTAATDLRQFLATIVARVSVPDSLHPHNPTVAQLGMHLACGDCRPSDPVVYQQPGRVWIRVGKASGNILSLPLSTGRNSAP